MDQERYEELQAVKKEVKKRNVDAVAGLMLDLRDQVYNAQNEMNDLRRLTTNVLQEQAQLRAEFNAFKAMHFANMGNGEMGN